MRPQMFNLKFYVMPRNKVLERAKVTMPSGRNAFDLSQVRSYDALAGDINIAYCQPFVAGTKGKISRKCFTRTAAVVSPAFHDVTEHFDFFIVPIHSLWRFWENWKLNINDMQDTLTVPYNGLNNAPDLSLPLNCPRVDFRGIIEKTFGAYTKQYVTEADAQKVAFHANNALRLIDALGYDERIAADHPGGSPRVMNLFMLAAYQKCYYDHYRNTAYEANNPYAYNFDWLYDAHNGLLSPDEDQPVPAAAKDNYVMTKLLEMHRVNYRNDYMHNIYPNMNYVSSVITGSSNFSLPSNYLGGSVAGTLNGEPYLYRERPQSQISPNVVSGYDGNGNTISVSVTQIRALFALDKLMRAAAYAPKHVRDQYKALYGVDGVEDFDMKSERIGSFQSTVEFQEVTNMAESSSYDLGSLGAKGIGGEGKSNSLSFYCKYDSIVIGLHYFIPRARYDAYGLHPWNVKISRESFYIKAFENLGLRPFYLMYNNGHETNATSIVLGWTTPNFDYKILPDLNTGAFKRVYDAWSVINPSVGIYTAEQGSVTNGELSTFVPHNNLVYVNVVTADYFKVAAEDLDNVFKVKVPATHYKGFCQFFGQFRISVPIVAPMSVHGQPSL